MSEHTVSISIGSGIGTTQPAPGNYSFSHGDDLVVSALPDTSQGFGFHHWTLNGVTYTANPLSFWVTKDFQVVAYFEKGMPPAPSYKCPYCGAEFPSQAALGNHIRIVHPEEVMPPPVPPGPVGPTGNEVLDAIRNADFNALRDMGFIVVGMVVLGSVALEQFAKSVKRVEGS